MKKNYRQDAQLLKRMAAEVEEKQAGVRSPFWRHVIRPRIEQNLSRADKATVTRLRRLDSTELDAGGLAQRLRIMAAETLRVAG